MGTTDPADRQSIVKSFIPYLGVGCYHLCVDQVTVEKGF
jgi:hypothetical protein